jgi:hypothetical protein
VEKMGQNWSLLHHGIKHFHRVKLFHGVKLFQGWSENSSDLNLIKNVWLQMKKMQRYEYTTSIEGLKKSLKKAGRTLRLKKREAIPNINLPWINFILGI